jgi:hypothetical protein
MYQFHRDEEYYKKMKTYKNNIDYFVNDKFLKKYTTIEDIKYVDLYNIR